MQQAVDEVDLVLDEKPARRKTRLSACARRAGIGRSMTDSYLTITPLGGLGEIGLNCQIWDTPEGSVLVDCGIMFPDEQQLGVDTVIPLSLIHI